MRAESLINEIHDFWFIEAGPDKWWKKDEAFDALIKEEFEALVQQATAGHLDSWKETPKGALALIILLDQFPRNIYRGTRQAFATDEKAKDIALYAIAKGHDKTFNDDESCFTYLPLEHSEDLADQEKCVALFKALGNDFYLKFAIAHKKIIEDFGRFPHRNAILGRPNTPEEDEYLKDPDAGF